MFSKPSKVNFLSKNLLVLLLVSILFTPNSFAIIQLPTYKEAVRKLKINTLKKMNLESDKLARDKLARDKLASDNLESLKKIKNLLQVETYPAFASDRDHPWFYNNYTYGRLTDYGDYFISANQAMRNGLTGYQYVLSAYPKINKHFYAFAEYAYSSSSLYPQDKAGLRAHWLLSKDSELATGGQYYLIQSNELWSYTVWLSKTMGKNEFSLRPLFYYSEQSKNILYMSVKYTYHLDEEKNYFVFSYGIGKTPDLLDLNANGFVIVNQSDYFGTYHFNIKNKAHLYFGAGYVRQAYPTGLVRKIPTLLYGLQAYF
jgi:YaiO family outer membrane protein